MLAGAYILNLRIRALYLCASISVGVHHQRWGEWPLNDGWAGELVPPLTNTRARINGPPSLHAAFPSLRACCCSSQQPMHILKESIRAGARVDVRDGRGYAPIHHAAETGNLPALRELLRTGSSHAWPCNDSMAPLAVACMCGHSTFVEHLFDNCGADPSAAKRVRQTPLAVATRLGHLEVVKVLLRFGVSKLGPTAYRDSLCGMAMSGDVTLMRELVQAEGGVHVQGAATPLKLTARYMHASRGGC